MPASAQLWRAHDPENLRRVVAPDASSTMTLAQIKGVFEQNYIQSLEARRMPDEHLRALLTAEGYQRAPGTDEYHARSLTKPFDYQAERRAKVRRWEALGLLPKATPTIAPPSNVIALPTATKATPPALFEIKTGGWDEPSPPIDWLVAGILPAAHVGLFVAQGNSLKTWTALDVARCVASGQPWLGRYEAKQGKALVVDLESGEREIKRRVNLLGSEGVDDRLMLASYPAARMHDPRAWAELAGIEGLRLVVIDSLAASGDPEVDENDVRAAAPLQLAGEFTERTGITVLYIHHANKGEKRDAREKVRGSSAIYAAADVVFDFTELEKPAAGITRATMKTIKDGPGPRPEPIRLELSDEHGLRQMEAPKPKPAREEKAPELHGRILLHVETVGSTAGYRELAAAIGAGEKAVQAALRIMKERGDLVSGPDRHLYPGDEVSQQRRIVAAIEASLMPGARPIVTKAELAKLAAAQLHVIDGMMRNATIVTTAAKGGHFFVPARGTASAAPTT